LRAAVPLVSFLVIAAVELWLSGITPEGIMLIFTVVCLTTLLFGIRWGLGAWIIGTAVLTVVTFAPELGWLQLPFEAVPIRIMWGFDELLLYLFLLAIIIIPTHYLLQGLQQSLTAAATTADALEETNAALEQRVTERTAELQQALDTQAQQARELAESLAAQRMLNETITALSLPVIPLRDDVLVVPLIGTVDTRRARLLWSSLLEQVEHTNARLIFLDVTGVLTIDAQVAQLILRLTTATRLLGAQVVLVGIRPEVAQTLVNQGLDLSTVRTAATLQTGLRTLLR
jgi:anti-anti-sigma factor